MRYKFWDILDRASHAFPILPDRVQYWICDKYDEALVGNVMRPTAAKVMADNIMQEERER